MRLNWMLSLKQTYYTRFMIYIYNREDYYINIFPHCDTTQGLHSQ